MVFKVPPQPEDKMCREFSALLAHQSAEVKCEDSRPDFKVWRCGVNEQPDAIGYWVGEFPNFYAYLVVHPLSLNGCNSLEIVRGWVDPAHRGTHFFSRLIRIASEGKRALVGDRDGMTEDAYEALTHLRGFRRDFFDARDKCFVPFDSVPIGDRFTAWEEGKRWLLVLRPESAVPRSAQDR